MQTKKQPTKTPTVSSKKIDDQSTVQTSTPVIAVENANKIVENKLQGKVVEVKKGGAKKKATEEAAQPVAQPVAQAAQPVAQVAQPVAQQVAQTAGKAKKQTKTTQAEKIVEQTVAQPVTQVVEPVVQTAGKSKKQTKTAQGEPVAQQVVQSVVQQVAQPVVQQGGKVKKTKEKVQEQVVQQVQEQDAQHDDEEEQVGGKLRYFKLFYNGQNKGRYCGKKPKQAANKAFSSIIKELNGNGQNGGANNQDINFSIKECTRSSKHKEYKYTGKREVLPEPVPVYIPHNGTVNADTIKSESSVKNIPIRQKKVETLHSGKEVTTNGGSVFLMSDNGQTFKKITYHFHNKIQKAPKVAEEVAVA
jgi:hypothetical protein